MLDEPGAPLDDVLGRPRHAEPEHRRSDQPRRDDGVAPQLCGRGRREILPGQAGPLQEVGGERGPVERQFLGQGYLGPLTVLVDRDPHAGGYVEGRGWAAGSAATLGDLGPRHGIVLGRVQQGQHAISELARQRQHLRAHRSQVDRYPLFRGRAEVGAAAPRTGAGDVGRGGAVQQRSAGQQRLARPPQRCGLGYPGSFEELRRARGEPQHGATARELLEGRGVHGQFHRVGRVGVEHPGAEQDPVRRRGGCRQQDGGGAQEQVVRHPELVEPGLFSGDGQLDEGRDGQVVVEPEAGAER